MWCPGAKWGERGSRKGEVSAISEAAGKENKIKPNNWSLDLA